MIDSVEYNPKIVSKRQKYRLHELAVGESKTFESQGRIDVIRIGVALWKFRERYGGLFKQHALDDKRIQVTRLV